MTNSNDKGGELLGQERRRRWSTASFEGGSFDGGDIQDISVRYGLLRIERREGECGEGCACREYGFPAQCFRKTPILNASAENSAPQNAKDENVAQDREEKNV